MAATAPDHGRLIPWRFVVVPVAKRHLLAQAFAQALLDRDAGATPEQIAAAKEKAHRAPFLMLAVVRLAQPGEAIPDTERMVSAGCAIQNVLLAAHALGYGAALSSGQAMQSSRLQTLFSLQAYERPLCCISIGTVTRHKATDRVRPSPEVFTSSL
jgi:nitroreductase